MFEIILKPSVEKQMDRLPGKVRLRVLAALEHLRSDPRPVGCVKLSGEENLWRLRMGSYRVVYEIHDERLILLVLRVAHRKDAYRGL
jgi:mRNA interferase RelE/StbE